MPSLEWIGKKAILNHHREVPYHLLKADPSLSIGDPGSGNLVVQGDNLLALKALLPYYAGRVKCIYIDPPYNTGNEGWQYNDAVNSPEMRAWLGKAVGKEAEDLSRHDKWLCMMYPRLQLLKQFLKDDGAIFISIDDNEVANLRGLMDEIFGARNFVATIIWQKVYSPKNSARHFSEDHDYILVYAKSSEKWRPNLVSRSEEQDRAYKNPDNDERGVWKTSDLSARNFYSLGTYPVVSPTGRKIDGPPKGRYWTVSPENFERLNSENRIWWGKKGDSIPQLKRFLTEVKQGVVPQTLWTYKDVGHTQEAKQEVVGIVNFDQSKDVFITPKPTRLLRRIIEVATEPDSIIMDSFAGSGTTGHAVLQANKADGGSRRFVLVEMDSSIARTITAQRLKNAIQGYTAKRTGAADSKVEALSGGFQFCTLATALFGSEGQISTTVSFEELARHSFFSETGLPLTKGLKKSPLIGTHNGIAYFLLFNGILGDKRPIGGNVLTSAVLQDLPKHDGPKVIFGDGCKLSPSRLQRDQITFKQIPYHLRIL